ncbi:hypothetical protein CEXT_207611 [Caerostris extrusa]|uniref:Uncharacterized protein n=1 Tax=Caerostris extrusa TaxID=172846 RepID=A0AAV4XTH1_CAEEX|nr:hypothetical protein CEXT_207611 [Caerostris extrusa]
MKGVSSEINETIWIDDSFIEPHPVMNKNKTYSFNNEKSEKEKSDCDKQILSEINEYENFKKDNTEVVSSNADETIYIDDSVNTSYEPMLEIKKTKSSSEKNVSYSVSLVKEPYTPKESYSKAKIYNSNNTICLDDSPVCLISNIKKEKKFF